MLDQLCSNLFNQILEADQTGRVSVLRVSPFLWKKDCQREPQKKRAELNTFTLGLYKIKNYLFTFEPILLLTLV